MRHYLLLPLLLCSSGFSFSFRLRLREDAGAVANGCNSLQISGGTDPAAIIASAAGVLASRQDAPSDQNATRCVDSDVENGDLGQTYRSNVVNMPFEAPGFNLVLAHFVVEDLSITDGQDPMLRNRQGQDNRWGPNGHISWIVGRKGSTQVSNWWKARVQAGGNSFNQNPDALNFAFAGTMTLKVTGALSDTFTIPGVVIAQGSTIFSNNWWVGGYLGQYSPSRGTDVVRLPGRDSKGFPYQFYLRRGGFESPVNEIKLVAIEASPYKLVPLLEEFKGENTQDTWQTAQGGIGQVPPYVTYYQRMQARALKLSVENNLLYDSTGKLFNTDRADQSRGQSVAIFVVDDRGVVFASNQHKEYMFHHSSIVGGRPVASAGEIAVKDGVIQNMRAVAGHYRPAGDLAHLQLVEALFRQGYLRDIPYTQLGDADLAAYPGYNVTLGANGTVVAGQGNLTQAFLSANDLSVTVPEDPDCPSIPAPVVANATSDSLVTIDNSTTTNLTVIRGPGMQQETW